MNFFFKNKPVTIATTTKQESAQNLYQKLSFGNCRTMELVINIALKEANVNPYERFLSNFFISYPTFSIVLSG